MCAKQKKQLLVELIPKTCHYSNVRTTVKPSEWDKLRFLTYDAANNKCEICGETGKKQGYKHEVECHEIWEYDDENHVQKLTGLIALCPFCHLTKHIGRAIATGREKICYVQMSKVNKWTQEEIKQHILESFETHKQRSEHEWGLDLSILTQEPYNIKLKATKKRIFEVKKYKKRPKKKSSSGTKNPHPKERINNLLKGVKQPNKRPPKKTKN
jgi:hypothetical protein